MSDRSQERPAASSSGGDQRLAGGDRDGSAAPMGKRPARSAAYVARLEAALQQIADDEYVPGPTANQWLVERGQPEGEPQAIWHSHIDPSAPWTTDAWRASMFPTREAAEEWITEHGLEARAVEHGFMSRLAPREIAREALNRG